MHSRAPAGRAVGWISGVMRKGNSMRFGTRPRFWAYTGGVAGSRDHPLHGERAMALKLDVSRAEDIVIVRCRGRIIFGEEADELRRTILGLLNETKRIVLNLAGVSHIDSCGLGTLVASFISARNREAEIKFAALSPKARRVLGITKVRQL